MIRLQQAAIVLSAILVVAAATGLAQKPNASENSPAIPLRLPSFGLGPPPESTPATPRSIGAVAPRSVEEGAQLIGVERIWDQAPHNAFTDLIRFRERWYCAFREGTKHVSPDGGVRVISSADGAEWESAFYISSEYADIRDPKFSITSDRRLMLSATAAYNPPTEIGHQSLAWYTIDGRNWGIPFRIGDPEVWLWRIAWHRGSAYSMAYSTLPERFTRMYVGPEGLRFQTVADKVLTEGSPSEATLLFNNDDSTLCLLRRDGGTRTAFLGLSRPPYRGWEWVDLGIRIGGPNMIRIPDGRIVAAGRLYDGRERTSLCWLDQNAGTLTEFLELPSGGDNSYPGLVFHEDLLWVSYYSSHEEKTSVYLAKVKLPLEKQEIPNEKPRIAF